MNACVLAGGVGRRLGAGMKATLLFADGLRLIDIVVARLKESNCFNRILIVSDGSVVVSNTVSVSDDEELKGTGALGGLLSGLAHSDAEWNFVCACDMPFIKPQLIKFLKEKIEDEYDAIVPRWNGYIEPLCAFYNKRVLRMRKHLIKDKELSLISLIHKIRTFFVEEEMLRNVDEELLSFFNINTEQDMETARRLWPERGAPLVGL
jgi:molybdopterin-guanine dinucleotide biosynthesis protein A